MFQNLHRCWSYYCDMKVKCPTCSESSKQQQQHQQQQQPQQQMQHQQKWINIDEEFLYTDCSGACGSDSRLVGCWFWASFLPMSTAIYWNFALEWNITKTPLTPLSPCRKLVDGWRDRDSDNSDTRRLLSSLPRILATHDRL